MRVRDLLNLLKLLSKWVGPKLPGRGGGARRIGDKSAVPALLEAAGNTFNLPLQHSLTYALIEMPTAKYSRGLKSDKLWTIRVYFFWGAPPTRPDGRWRP